MASEPHRWVCDGIIRRLAGVCDHNAIYGWTCEECGGVTWTQGRPLEGPGEGSLVNSRTPLVCPRTAWERLDAT